MGYLLKFKSPDFLWDTLDVAIWSDIEQGLAITAGSLATLRPLYRELTSYLGWSEGASRTFPTGDHKNTRGWYRTPSDDNQKRSGPFSLVSISRVGDDDARSSGSSDGKTAERVGRPEPIKLRNDLVEDNEQNSGYNSWRIQAGKKSEDEVTVARGITRQTDVFQERHNHRI